MNHGSQTYSLRGNLRCRYRGELPWPEGEAVDFSVDVTIVLCIGLRYLLSADQVAYLLLPLLSQPGSGLSQTLS